MPTPAPYSIWIRDGLSDYSSNLGDITAGRLHDNNNKFLIDLNNQLLTVTDNQATPQIRVQLGKIDGVNNTDYGIIIYDQTGKAVLDLTGLGIGVVGTNQIIDLSITTLKLIDQAVTTAKIANQAVTAAQLANNTVTQQQMSSGLFVPAILSALPTLPSGSYPQGAIVFLTTDNKLYRSTGAAWTTVVPTTDLSGTISTTQIADGAVTTVKLGNAAVTSTQLADGSVVTAKIGNQAVTTTQLANGAVTQVQMASGLTVPVIVSSLPVLPSSSYPAGAIVSLTTDNKLYRSTGNTWVASVPTTDLTGTIGTSQIANSAITNALIASSAIDVSKFVAGLRPVEILAALPAAGTQGRTVFLTSDNKLYRDTGSAWTTVVPTTDLSGQIVNAQIANAAVNTAQIAANAITAALIAAGAVGTTQIANQAVSTTQLANQAVTAAQIANLAIGAQHLDGTTIQNHGVFLWTFENQSVSNWFLRNGSAGVESFIAGAGVTGGYVYQATGYAWRVWPGKIPYDTSKLYRIRFRIRKTVTSAGTGAVYLGLEALAADGVTFINSLGANNNGNMYYMAASNLAQTDANLPPGTWVEKTAWFKGVANPLTGAATPTSPSTLWTGVAYFRPLFIVNYNTGTDTIQVDYISVDVFDEDGLVRSYQGLNVDGTIAANKVVANSIAAGVITGAKIAATTITASNIAANTITAAQIAAGTITTTQIAAATILGSNIAAGTIAASNIVAATITSAQIAAGTIQGSNILAGTITGSLIAAGTITATNIAADTITAGQIAAGAIGASELAAGVITTTKLVAGFQTYINNANPVNALKNPGFESGNVFWNGGTIVNNSANAHTGNYYLEITGTLGVYTDSFNADESNANTYFEINPGDVIYWGGWANKQSGDSTVFITIEVTDLNKANPVSTPTAAISGTAWAKYTNTYTVPAGKKYLRFFCEIANDGTIATVARFDDLFLTIQVPGASIVAGSITATQIAAGTITATQIAVGTITGSLIAAGTITASNIAVDTITASQIAAGAIGASELAAGAVVAGKIAAGVITTNEIAANTILGSNIAAGTITASNIAADTITAGQIAAGAIGASELAAGVITTDKLVAGFQQFLANPNPINGLINSGFEDSTTQYWSGGGVITNNSANAHSGNYYLHVNGVLGSYVDTFQVDEAGNNRWFEVNPGDTVYWGGWIYREVGDSSITIVTQAVDKDKVSVGFNNTGNAGAAGSWGNYTGLYVVPANVKYIRLYCEIANDGTIATNARFDDLFLTVQLPGASIVAASITADRLSVGTLSAISANLGTVTAGLLRDTNSKFTVDLGNVLLSVVDAQATPVTRIQLGKLGVNPTDYGLIIKDQNGNTILSASGLGASVVGQGNMQSRNRCRIKRSGTQSITQNTWTAIVWQASDYNVGSLWNSVTNPSRITIPTGGGGVPWLFAGVVGWGNTGNQTLRQIAIYKNGSLLVSGPVQNAIVGTTIQAITWTDVPADADYYELYGNCVDGTGSVNTTLDTQFSALTIW